MSHGNFDRKCKKLAHACSERHHGFMRGWRSQDARRLYRAAVRKATPAPMKLSAKEKRLLASVEAHFAEIVHEDTDFRDRAHREAEAQARRMMADTGADELFGFVEDIVNGKSSARGKALLARAKRLYEGLATETV